MALAADGGLEAMTSAETNPNERGLGKPCAGKPPARFDEGESSAAGNRFAALSTLLSAEDCRGEMTDINIRSQTHFFARWR